MPTSAALILRKVESLLLRHKKDVRSGDIRSLIFVPLAAQNPQIRGFDLTQAQFAEMLGIRQNTLSNYERGKIVPTLEMLLKLKARSGKSIDWIVFGETPSTQ